jgi:hypothetical protein
MARLLPKAAKSFCGKIRNSSIDDICPIIFAFGERCGLLAWDCSLGDRRVPANSYPTGSVPLLFSVVVACR